MDPIAILANDPQFEDLPNGSNTREGYPSSGQLKGGPAVVGGAR